jgi:hypothetical protein
MTKAMFGIAGALALTVAPAWARDVKADEKAARDTVGSTESASKSVTRVAMKRASKSVSEGGTGSAAPAAGGSAKAGAIDVTAPAAERWLVEREGYRDGGY